MAEPNTPIVYRPTGAHNWTMTVRQSPWVVRLLAGPAVEVVDESVRVFFGPTYPGEVTTAVVPGHSMAHEARLEWAPTMDDGGGDLQWSASRGVVLEVVVEAPGLSGSEVLPLVAVRHVLQFCEPSCALMVGFNQPLRLTLRHAGSADAPAASSTTITIQRARRRW